MLNKNFFKISGLAFFYSILSLVSFAETNFIDTQIFEYCVQQIKDHRLTQEQKQAFFDALAETKGTGSNTDSESRNKKRRLCEVVVSPIKAKKAGGIGQDIRNGVVYAIIAQDAGGTKIAPQHSDRIDFADLVTSNDPNDWLNPALLQVELKLRRLISDNPLLYYRAAYVGLAESLTHRFTGHSKDLKPVAENANVNPELSRWYGNRKERFFASAFRSGMDAQTSALVYGVYLMIILLW